MGGAAYVSRSGQAPAVTCSEQGFHEVDEPEEVDDQHGEFKAPDANDKKEINSWIRRFRKEERRRKAVEDQRAVDAAMACRGHYANTGGPDGQS